MSDTKKPYFVTAFSFILINILLFCSFYIPNFITGESSEPFEYLRIFASKLFDFVMPLVAATVMFLGYSSLGAKNTLIRAILLSMPQVFYILPYYYIYFWVNGNDSIEAISLSALVTLFGVAVFYGESVLMLYVIRAFARLPIVKGLKKDLPRSRQENTPKELLSELRKKADEVIENSLTDRSVLSLGSPVTAGILAAAFTEFCISFIFEISDIITYLVEYRGDYRIEDVIFYTAVILFLAVELLAGHSICCFIRNLIIKRKEDKA